MTEISNKKNDNFFIIIIQIKELFIQFKKFRYSNNE